MSSVVPDDLIARFARPKIDDEGLVIADALIAGVVAPGLEAIVCVVFGLPPPAWTNVLGRRRLVTPTLLRGINLSAAWFGGALAAKMYERDAFDFPPPRGRSDRYAVTLRRCLAAGSFATALLLASTQLSILATLGFVQFGDDPQVDEQLLRLADDLVRDVATEATVLLSWRLARTYLSKLDFDDPPSERQ